jgi:hypothetical protein
MPQHGIRGMSARNPERDREISLSDRAAPDFVAALSPTNDCASRSAKQLSERAVELWSHLDDSTLSFAQRRNLQINRGRFDAGMIVG